MTNDLLAQLFSHFPSKPARLLLIDAKLHDTHEYYELNGCQITKASCFIPNDFAQYPSTTRATIHAVSFPNCLSSAEPFSCCIFLNYSPEIHVLDLFDKLLNVIDSNGIVLVVGENLSAHLLRLQDWLAHTSSIALRCGFDLLDHSGFFDEQGAACFVLKYSRNRLPRWRLSHVRKEHFSEIADLFQNVFGHTLSRELWDWKYSKGHGNAVVARRNGEIVAHYGGIYRDVLCRGRPYWVFQACDVMVKASERGVLTRQGPFFLTAATTAEIYGPPAYGFPTARHTLVTIKMGLSCEVGKMVEFRWKPISKMPFWMSRCRIVDSLDLEQHQRIDQLWNSLAADLKDAVVGVRNWSYLNKRYVQHPHFLYDIVEIFGRFTNESLGVIVLRRLENSCELLDIVGPLKNFKTLIRHAQRFSALWKLPYVFCWMTDNFSDVFDVNLATREALDLSVLSSCWTKDAQVEIYKDRWWLSSGDTDFR